MKVFSSYDDYGYEEERLYSVLMSEEELSLFSEIQKEFNSKARKALRTAWETSVGKKAGIPQYISKDYKTILNPEFRSRSRDLARDSINPKVSPLMSRINERGRWKHYEDRSLLKSGWISQMEYDHGRDSHLFWRKRGEIDYGGY